MDIKRELKEIHEIIVEVEEGLSEIYYKILSQNQGQANEVTESMTEIIKIAEDLKGKMGKFLDSEKTDSS